LSVHKMDTYLKQKSSLSFGLIVLGGALFLIIILAYFFYNLEPVQTENSVVGDDVKYFKVTKGDGFKLISARLSQEKLIKSITVFKIYSLLTGNAQKFQPGVYELTSAMSVPHIVNTFVKGGENEETVVIAEGFSLKDVDFVLAGAGVIKAGSLANFDFSELKNVYPFLQNISSLEGFLFPDTYRLERDSASEDVVRIFLDNFEKKAWSLLKENKNWYENLILASILEREVISFDDRQIVAGILLKRIRLDIPMQVDASISYAKCEGKTLNCDRALIVKADLSLSSPYNSYQKLGWTPTPITNPGQSAIKAALSPNSSRYMYYLSAKNTKETMFSETLEEHNEKRAKYL